MQLCALGDGLLCIEEGRSDIRQLKEALADRESEVQSVQVEWESQQRGLQLQLEQEEAASHDLQVYSK